MSSRGEGSAEVVSAPPVFFLSEETPDDVTHVDICVSAERLVGFGGIVGAQRLGALWRLYPTTREVRAKLLTGKLLMGGRSIPLRSQNPFSIRNRDGQEIPSTRLSIDGLPVSVASSDLEGYLRKAGASLRSPLLWEKARDRAGKLTRWVTGRRFVWIDLPASPLPQRLQVGSFFARLFYREQPRPMLCFMCGKEGHKKGDPQCRGRERAIGNDLLQRVSDESEEENAIERSGGSVTEDSSDENPMTEEVGSSGGEEEEEKVDDGGDKTMGEEEKVDDDGDKTMDEEEKVDDDGDKTMEKEKVDDDGDKTMEGGDREPEAMKCDGKGVGEEQKNISDNDKTRGGGQMVEGRGDKGPENSEMEGVERSRRKKKVPVKQKKEDKELSKKADKEVQERSKKSDRGQAVQLTLSSLFSRSDRAPSLKRQEPPSPGEGEQEAHRPKR